MNRHCSSLTQAFYIDLLQQPGFKDNRFHSMCKDLAAQVIKSCGLMLCMYDPAQEFGVSEAKVKKRLARGEARLLIMRLQLL